MVQYKITATYTAYFDGYDLATSIGLFEKQVTVGAVILQKMEVEERG